MRAGRRDRHVRLHRARLANDEPTVGRRQACERPRLERTLAGAVRSPEPDAVQVVRGFRKDAWLPPGQEYRTLLTQESITGAQGKSVLPLFVDG